MQRTPWSMRANLQHVERIADVGRRPLLTGVCDEVQAELAATGEHAGELLRRVAALAAVEPDADQKVAVGQRRFQRLEGRLFAQMPQEAHDQRALDAELPPRRLDRAAQALDHGADGDAAVGVRLRVEEELGPHDVIGRGAAKVGHRHIEEIGLLQQHARAGVVDVEKTLQIGERIGSAQRLDVRVRQRDAVALGERENQLGFERTFDVDVQLGLGHRAQQRGQTVAGNRVEVDHGRCIRSARERGIEGRPGTAITRIHEASDGTSR